MGGGAEAGFRLEVGDDGSCPKAGVLVKLAAALKGTRGDRMGQDGHLKLP